MMTIPYGRHWIDQMDIDAVIEVLRSDWLTTGPKVTEFEQAFAQFVGAREAVALSSGTAALHAAMFTLDIGPGDEVIVPSMTFAASANCVVFQGGTPVFADVSPETALIDPATVESKITPRTKAIIAMDFAGHPCDYDPLREIADRHGLVLVSDACHSLGGRYKDHAVGTLADLSAFSLHPVKHITTGEGGMVTSNDPDAARRIRMFRNHGITSDHRQRERLGSWYYEMVALGYNYRLTDFQCALGINQLRKLPGWLARRRDIARRYDTAFNNLPAVKPLRVMDGVSHAYHLYVLRMELDRLRGSRADVFSALRAEGIGVNVHYIPVHLHPYYQEKFGTAPGLCPIAEWVYERIVTLPLFPCMTDEEVEYVISSVEKVIGAFLA
jgi:perosamine synthetase